MGIISFFKSIISFFKRVFTHSNVNAKLNRTIVNQKSVGNNNIQIGIQNNK